jgi:hypothetical protein
MWFYSISFSNFFEFNFESLKFSLSEISLFWSCNIKIILKTIIKYVKSFSFFIFFQFFSILILNAANVSLWKNFRFIMLKYTKNLY